MGMGSSEFLFQMCPGLRIPLSYLINPESHIIKPRYNEPQYSEFRDIVNKTQFPFRGFTKHIIFDIVNYLI